MIRPARWLPLSLALHAATLAGTVWVARELAERALFVDLTLNEPDERAVGAGSGGGAAGVPRATQGASSSPRPGPLKARTPTRGTAGAASSPPAPATSSSPAAASSSPAPAPTAPPAPATPSPAPGPPAEVAPSPPAAPSAAISPTVASPAPVESPRDAESARPAAPAPAAEIVGAVEPSATRASGVGPAAASATSAPGGAASIGTEGGDKRGAAGGTAAAGPRGEGGAGDGQLALAIPGGGGAEMYGPYLAALRRRLQEELEYPPAARRRGLSGTVDLEIALESTGRVSKVSLVRSSSHAILDDAALTAARKLSRVPFPPDVKPRALRVRLPVVFELR